MRQQSADIAVIEGVRGLYEGYDGDLGSTAQIAKMLQDARYLRGRRQKHHAKLRCLVKGYMDFDPEVQFKGVILNKVGSERHAQKAIKEIERYAGVEVVGVIRRNEDMHLAMRHLGLVPVLEGKTRHEGFPERVDQDPPDRGGGPGPGSHSGDRHGGGAAAGGRAGPLPRERSWERIYVSAWPGMRPSTSTTGTTWS